MPLSNQQIIALLNIKGLGIKSVIKIGDYAQDAALTLNTTELFNLVNDFCVKKIITGNIKLSIEQLNKAIKKADSIIEKSTNKNIGIISRYNKAFPHSLKQVVDKKGIDVSPVIMYYKGDINTLLMPSIAIIGTRTPTKEGIIASRYYSFLYAEKGFNIISGLAKGCDTEAHKGALQSNIGKTCAILAHGLDSIYPPENKDLAENILTKGGLLLSEYPIGTILERHNLVARNRLQAGLAQATIVIQTGIKGGTHHAALATLAAQKPLFCVDFNDNTLMEQEQVKGNKVLIEKEGAKPLNSKNSNSLVLSIQQQNQAREYIQGKLF